MMNAIAFREQLAEWLNESTQYRDQYDDPIESTQEEYQVIPPTPQEIKERCAEIQKEWTPRERLKRAGFRRDPSLWSPPTVAIGDPELAN